MRETRLSGSEGGVADSGHPYPYPQSGCELPTPPDNPNSPNTPGHRLAPPTGVPICGVPQANSGFAFMGWVGLPSGFGAIGRSMQ